MPLKQFINSRALALCVLTVCVTGLSACSSNAIVEKTEPLNQEVEALDTEKDQLTNEVAELEPKAEPEGNAEQVDVGTDKEETHAEKVEPIPAVNLYLQQQAQNPIEVSTDIQETYQQGLKLMSREKWQQAIALFDQVIAKQPQLSGSYVNKAVIAKKQGQLSQAQVLLAQAIEINKLNLYAHHLQGQVYRLQGEFDEAEQSYLTALAIWPDYTEAQASMAVLLELYRGRLLDAYSYYHGYLQLKPDDEEIKRWQAGLAIKIKRAGLTVPSTEEIKVILEKQAQKTLLQDSSTKASLQQDEVKDAQ